MVLRACSFLLLFVFLYSSSFAKEEVELRDFHYTVDVELQDGQSIFEKISEIVSESEIASEINQLRIFSQQHKTVSSMRALRDRLTSDIDAIYQKAHFLGYYGADIRYKSHVGEKVRVEIYVDLGQIFNLKLNVKYVNQDADFNKKYSSLLLKKLRAFKASMRGIKSLINIAVEDLQRDGFFEPEVLEKRVYINYAEGEAVLNLTIDTKRRVTFGDVNICAFPGIDEEFIKNRIDWNKGEVFDIEKVEATTYNLKNTDIFSSVKVNPDKEKIADDAISMNIKLKEDKKHAVGISVLYSGTRNMNFEKKSQTQKSLKSIIARLSWENYNTFGGGEKLRFIAEGTPMKANSKRADYAFEIIMSQPDVCWRNNTVDYSVSRRQELTNVFFKKSDKTSFMLNYPLAETLFVRAGSSFEQNYIDGSDIFFPDTSENRKYGNFILPLEFVLDETDDLLNPTSGYRATLKFSKMFFKSASASSMETIDGDFSYNFPLDDLRKTILAFDVKGTKLFEREIDDIPIDKRVYAGGINSIRGYANQMAGEIVVGEETPMGGKASIEFSAEMRRKFTADFGGVLFFDGAKIFQNRSCYENIKTEKKKWFFSVGLGVRYFTSIGPIRMDFAFPIKRRKGIDSKMQFVMSLGQAF